MKRRPSSLPITCNTSHTFIGFSLLKPVWVFRMSRFVLCTRSHFSEARPPPAPAESFRRFQNKTQMEARRERHVAFTPLGRERGDYGGLHPSVILHFSSPQHLPSLPLNVVQTEKVSILPSISTPTAGDVNVLTLSLDTQQTI